MEIMELAVQLGAKIKEDERVKRYMRAKEAYISDGELQSVISEYNTHRMAMDEEMKKDVPDNNFVEIIEARIDEIYNEVMENAVYTEYSEASNDFHELMHAVNSELTYQVTGERPCSHEDCSSCSGCH